MVDKINYLLPAAIGAAGLSLYAYFEYNTWLKQKRAKNAEDDKVNHQFMLNKAYASSVIGQVDLIASSTDTDIGIDKLTEDDVILSLNIRGRKENVKEAESYINRIIEATPDMTTMSIVVPKERLMAMLGDYGDKIHGLSQETGCKINLKCDPVLMAGSPFYIEIEGPTDEVMFAYDKVKEMLARDPTVSSPSELDSLPKEMRHLTSLDKSSTDNNAAVIISAVKTPSQFWLQIYSLGNHLDTLERKIFGAFSSPNTSTLEVLKPQVGSYVAIPHTKHGKWHRARIVSCENGPEFSDLPIVKAMFIDYGYTEVVNPKEVRRLPEEFLRIPYFAMECSLSGVSPIKGDEWSKEAIECFSMMTYKSKRIFTAFKTGQIRIQEGDCVKSITSVTLVDSKATSEGKSIAQELVDRGYAHWKKRERGSTKSDSVNGDSESGHVKQDEL